MGTVVNSSTARFTLGAWPLYGGISLVALAMGLFDVAETIASIQTLGAHTISARGILCRPARI